MSCLQSLNSRNTFILISYIVQKILYYCHFLNTLRRTEAAMKRTLKRERTLNESAIQSAADATPPCCALRHRRRRAQPPSRAFRRRHPPPPSHQARNARCARSPNAMARALLQTIVGETASLSFDSLLKKSAHQVSFITVLDQNSLHLMVLRSLQLQHLLICKHTFSVQTSFV